MDNLKLKIDLDKSVFIKNEDDTYYVITAFDTGYMAFPRVTVDYNAEAIFDDTLGGFYQWRDYPKRFAKIRNFFKKIFNWIKMIFAGRDKDIC